MIQVEKEHYYSEDYFSQKRFVSYHHQIRLMRQLNPESILEIGVGANLHRTFLADQKYISVDIDKSLKPDVVGTVMKLPFGVNSFDLIAAFQVLEHLPFENFIPSLLELKRVAKKYVIISLPYANHCVEFSYDLPILKPKQFSIRIPKMYKSHKFDGQHYWELGKLGYSNRVIIREIKKIFNLIESFTPYGNNYNKFFILKKIG